MKCFQNVCNILYIKFVIIPPYNINISGMPTSTQYDLLVTNDVSITQIILQLLMLSKL